MSIASAASVYLLNFFFWIVRIILINPTVKHEDDPVPDNAGKSPLWLNSIPEL
jgi:hypothetical protein